MKHLHRSDRAHAVSALPDIPDRAPPRRRPTRRDLLVLIGALQDVLGRALSAHHDDRSQNQHGPISKMFEDALATCIEARSHDEPIVTRAGEWGRPMIPGKDPRP